MTVYTQSVAELDRRAQKFFNNKEFSKAVSLWLNILDIEPNNKEIEKKIERLYELKQKKDLSLEKSKYNYIIAKREIFKNRSKNIKLEDAQKNLKKAQKFASGAFSNFIVAYRIDPKDPVMQPLRLNMERLERRLNSEANRLKQSLANRKRVRELTLLAQKAMDDRKFREALVHWNAILDLMPGNVDAIEGKRQAIIAINNLVRYENIQRYLSLGIVSFNRKNYNEARENFMRVLQFDPGNASAEDYIEKINYLVDRKKRLAKRKRQAETFYLSGIKNTKDNKFDEARSDYENTLVLVPNYKDTELRLSKLDSLRKAYEKRLLVQKLRRISIEFQNGMIALTEGAYQDAIAAFDTTLKLDPENKLAAIYMQRAKDAQSQKDEEVVDENSPYFDFINSLIVSGRRLFDDGRYGESKKRWEQILELFPKNRLAASNLLKCELKLNPDQKELFLKRLIEEGEKLIKKRDILGARRKFELAESINPDDPRLKILLSRVGERGAFISTTRLPGVSKEEINRRLKLGMAFYRRGGSDNMRKALVQLRWVVARDPGNVQAVVSVNKIEAQFRSGRATPERSTRGLSERQERLARRYYYDGINYYSNNNFKRAIASWRKVLAIDPNHKRAKNNIRKCLVLLGR